jgi:hypothetical protein
MLTKHRSALILICLCATAVWAQQVASPSDPVQAPTETQTIDGVPTCPLKIKTLPNPIYRAVDAVEQPKPISTPEAKFSDEARIWFKKQHIKKFEAVSLVGMTIDETGMPQDICIVKQAGYGLDKQAFIAVAKYRFKPATFNGKSVAMRLAVEVKFKSY